MADRTDPPLVTIVVPVYNGARYLRQCLDSIVGQTYPSVEVLVIDDASTDESWSILAGFGDHVEAIRHRENQGQFDTVNHGISQASGRYIAVYHADDVYDPEIVAEEVRYLEATPAAGAVFCLSKLIDANGDEVGRIRLPPELEGGGTYDFPVVLDALLKYKNRFLPTPSSMVRASVYRQLGGFKPEFGIAADFEMWLRILGRHSVGIIPRHLFSYRARHGNASQAYFHLRIEPERFFQIVDDQFSDPQTPPVTSEALREYEAHRSEDQILRAINHYIRGDLAESRDCLSSVATRTILQGRNVERHRLLALLWGLRALARLPRNSLLADLFYRRWHDNDSRLRRKRGFLRKVRGVLGTGMIWGVAGTLFGSVVGAIASLFGGSLVGSAMIGGLWFGATGFLIGSGFAVILSIVHGRRTLDDLTPGRAALWGAAVGAAIPVVGNVSSILAVGASLGPLIPSIVTNSVLYGALAGSLAAGTVIVAKRAPELPAGRQPESLETPDSTAGDS